MSKNQTATRKLASIGEEISHQLGAKMVKDFQDANPNEVVANFIGKNIIERILSQPGCEGILFYNGINEMGKKSLVYMGVDNERNIISEFTAIDASGQLMKEKGIVADRSDWNWNED